MKRTAALILLLALICIVFPPVNASSVVPVDDYQLQAMCNESLTAEINGTIPAIADAFSEPTNNSDFSIILARDSTKQNVLDNSVLEQWFTAEGTIAYANECHTYTASGFLCEIILTGDNSGLIGTLSGKTENGTHIDITIHAIVEEEKLLANVTVGHATETNAPPIIVFGGEFSELYELVDRYVGVKTPVSSDLSSSLELNVVEETVANMQSNDDYNPQYRSIQHKQLRDSDGITRRMLSSTMYGPVKIRPNGTFCCYLKINCYIDSVRQYVLSNYNLQHIGIWCSNAETSFRTETEGIGFDNYYPCESDDEFVVHIPLEDFFSFFDFLPIDISIPASAVSTDEELGAFGRVRKVTWTHTYSIDADCTGVSPIQSENGYSSAADFVLYNNTATVPIIIVGDGSITFTFNSAYATGTPYMGSVTVYMDEHPMYMGL